MKTRDKAKVGLLQNITMIKVLDESIVGELRQAIREEKSLEKFIILGQISEIYTKQNLIVDVGLNVLARLLAGDTTYSGEINYGALGTGSGTIAATDTQLESEQFRKLASDSSYDGKIAYVDFFYEKADCAGTYTRFGNFIDGEEGANTGQMWSHLGVNWTKTFNDGLFVSCKYTISYKS